MSQLKLTADSGGGTVAIKGPASTTGNAALDLTVPGTASATLDTLGRAGNILQVKNAIKTDTQSVTNDNSGNFTDVTGLSLSITPSSSSNKVLFRGYVALCGEANTTMAIRIFRDSTEIGKSTADSTAANNSTATAKSLNISSTTGKQQMHQLHFEVLDSPNTTSATTYKVKFAETHLHNYSGTTIYVNRPHTGMGSDQHGVISSVTAMEVAA
tara:strand:+ start:528 stop:1166 length:639 start_codon:yes stop_codon:yes gene_type:complete